MSGARKQGTCTFLEVRVCQAPAELLEQLYGLQITGALQPEDSIHCQASEKVLVLSQQFGAQGGAGNVHQILRQQNYMYQ